MSDTRCWRYRRGDDGEIVSEMFDSPEAVPAGWADSPANVDDASEEPKKKRGRPPKQPEQPEEVLHKDDEPDAFDELLSDDEHS